MLQDLRFAVRQLLKNPGFSFAAVLTLALAIGSTTAIFSAVDAVLLHPLPYSNPEQLVIVGQNIRFYGLSRIASAAPEFVIYRQMATCFSAIAGIRSRGDMTLTSNGEPESVQGASVTASVFPMLAVRPILGSLFTADDERYGNNHVVLITEGLWRRRFGGEPSIVGKNIELNRESYRVAGIIPPMLEYRARAEVWTPLAFSSGDLDPRNALKVVDTIGRLKPGVTLERARAEFRSIAARMGEQNPARYGSARGFSLDLDLLAERQAGDLKTPLLVLIAAVGAVMLIACANVSNLLLARAMVRRREVSIRAALGAARSRVVRQLLTESLLLSVMAGAAGVLLALYGLHFYAQNGPRGLIHGTQPELNGWVAAIALLLSVGASAIFGLAPAIETSRINLTDAIKEGSRGSTGGRRLLRESMVAVEVAVSLILVIGAALLVRSFTRLERADPGFRAENLLTAHLVLPLTMYKQPVQRVAFANALVERVAALPGVRSAGAVEFLPFVGSWGRAPFEIVGHPRDRNLPSPVVTQSRTSSGYFESMGIPLLRGRRFTPADDRSPQSVAVIDDALVKQYFGDMDPIGMQVVPSIPGVTCTVVGIAGSVKYGDLAGPPSPTIYYASPQMPSGSVDLAIRTAGNPLLLAGALRHEIAGLDAGLPVSAVRSMDQALADSLVRQRFSIELMAVFAGIAALLASIGIYGVLAYLVDQRRREVGIRQALGARPADILALVLRQGTPSVAAGLVVGIGGAWGLTRILKSQLYQVSATDPLTFALVPVGLAVVAMLAMIIPARRAARVNPVEALRQE